MRRPLPAPAEWAIRTCQEAAIVDMLLCWRYPPPSLAGDYDIARAEVGEALARLRTLGLSWVDANGGERLYDPCEVVNFLIGAGLSGHDRFWEEVVAPAHLRMLAGFEGRPFDWSRPPDFTALPSRRCEVNFDRTYHFETLAQVAPGRFKLPLPLEGAAQRRHYLDLRSDRDAAFRQFENRAELRCAPGAAGPLRIGFSATMTLWPCQGYEEELTPLDRELYTAPRENLIVISAAVAALGVELADSFKDPVLIVARFFHHIMGSYVAGRVPYHALDPRAPSDWPLIHGHFDCQIGSSLLIALCRSRGIPARLVGGYQVFNGYHAPHFWSEVWLDGQWLPYDFGGWEAMTITGDLRWADAFAGKCEYRLVFERYPRLFVGPSTLEPEGAWHHLLSSVSGSISSHICDAQTMRPILEDRVTVSWP